MLAAGHWLLHVCRCLVIVTAQGYILFGWIKIHQWMIFEMVFVSFLDWLESCLVVKKILDEAIMQDCVK